jgi:hypothetical protein
MVSPDYAAAGEFQGERKQPKRNSGGSKRGSRELINGGHSRQASTTSSRSKRASGMKETLSAKASGAGTDMLTSAGKDVLWFKGEEKPGVEVGSAWGDDGTIHFMETVLRK